MSHASPTVRSLLMFAAAGVICTSFASAVPIVIKTSQGNGADAEIREQAPEDARGTLAPTELAVRSSAGNHSVSLLRFDLTGVTVADIGNFADLRLTLRGNGNGNGNANGMRIYGLNAGAAQSNWSESTVHYRDAGTVFPAPAAPSPFAQPTNGAIATTPPAQPISATDPTWGSNPADATRAPGIVHENPNYSATVESTNQARYTANLAAKAGYDADLADDGVVQGTYAYQAYINQPSYATTTFTSPAQISDTVGRPMNSFNADFDAGATTFLGFLDFDAKTRAGGTEFSFSTTDENSPINHGAGDAAANRAAIVAFLTNLLGAGETSVTFLVAEKNVLNNGTNGLGDTDPLPARGDNLIFASKEFQPTGGAVGDWAPKLVLAPEPTSLAAVALGGMLLGRRRKA